MTLALLAVEAALLGRLIVTTEFLRRLAFTYLILWSIVSTLLYVPGNRSLYLKLATVSIVLQFATVVEATFWLTQRPAVFSTLAWAIVFGSIVGDRASLIHGIDRHGMGLAWYTIITVAIASMWTWTVAWTFGTEQAGKAKGRSTQVTKFDLILVAYLWIQGGAAVRFYYVERLLNDGTVNPDWARWEMCSWIAQIACMVLWTLTERRQEYIYHEGERDNREENARVLKRKLMFQKHTSPPHRCAFRGF